MNRVTACLFQVMCLVKKAKIMASQLNHWVQTYVIEDESPDEKLSNKVKWGKSAPSLTSAVVPPQRSMVDRIVSAHFTKQGKVLDCTGLFKEFVTRHNVVSLVFAVLSFDII